MGLEDKLKRLAERSASEKEIDWNQIRDLWLRAVRRLFTDIQGWMQPFADKKLVDIHRVPIELVEPSIGRYKCEALELDFSGQVIRFEPQGTEIIAAWGRINVFRSRRAGHQPQGETMLLMAGSRESPTWQLWLSRDREDARQFNQATLEALIELWIDV